MTLTADQWENFVAVQQGHLLQSWAWGQLKSRFGWVASQVHTGGNAGAQILFRRLPLGLTIAYIPKGPIVDWTDRRQCQTLFDAIHREAKKQRSVFLKIEPDVWQAEPSSAHSAIKPVQEFLDGLGFRPGDTIQPRTTIFIDINQDEAAILAAMKQKTRYNIRLAQKKGVTVRLGQATEVSIFHRLALTTANRNDFGVHSLAYYQLAFDLFTPERGALFIAEFEGEPIAALMVFRQDQAAYYFYGASSNEHRNLMPTYLIQWEAIRWARARGCVRYDLWGIPDADAATLEAEFEQRQNGLWGVYRFKRGFGGQVVQSLGAYDYVYNPLLYQLYKVHRNF